MSQTSKRQQNKGQKKNSIILCHRCSPRRIILIVTAGRMMELETLPEVQLVLLYSQVDGVHLLLHSSDGLLHGAHSSLNGS
jgi:hypothetical protein